MNTLSENQIQIVTDMVINNGLIFNEVNKTMLISDREFYSRIKSIKDYCYQFYIDTLNEEADIEFVLNHITTLLNKLAEYRKSYEGYDKYQCGYDMYKFMNSFFDVVNEAFNDFFETL